MRQVDDQGGKRLLAQGVRRFADRRHRRLGPFRQESKRSRDVAAEKLEQAEHVVARYTVRPGDSGTLLLLWKQPPEDGFGRRILGEVHCPAGFDL